MAILTPATRRVALVALVLAVAASPTLAQDFSPVIGFFTTIGTAITGPLGRAVALLGVAFVGFMAMRGKFDWGIALNVGLGIIIVFGAATILAGFA